MRDGAKLFAYAYVPVVGTFKDAGPYPILITKTPYSCAPYGEDKYATRVGPSAELMESGYIFVCEDARGRTALMLAAAGGQAESVDVLLAHGADPNAADANGTTPLKAALAADRPAIAAALRRAGAR